MPHMVLGHVVPDLYNEKSSVKFFLHTINTFSVSEIESHLQHTIRMWCDDVCGYVVAHVLF